MKKRETAMIPLLHALERVNESLSVCGVCGNVDNCPAIANVDQLNAEMAKNADGLIAIWDGVSPGTKNMVFEATEWGVRLIPWEEERLQIFAAAELARRHRTAGMLLNHPEAVALI